jgi:hypothetical protein
MSSASIVPEAIMRNMMTRKYGTSRLPEAHRRDERCSNPNRRAASASIVAGAAVLLQSWAAKHGGTLSTARLREVMSNPYINTHPANDRIGVMPDLRGIIQHLTVPLRWRDDIIRDSSA